MERMQIALGCEEISHMRYIVFCYFKINCFSGGDTICRSLSSKSQYMWYVAHPISGTPKDLPQSGNWYPSSDSPRNAAAKQHLKVVFKTANSKQGIWVAAKLGTCFDGAPDPSPEPPKCHTLSHLVAPCRKRLKHRVFDLYRPGITNYARNELRIGVRGLWELVSVWTMEDDDISIISVWKLKQSVFH